MCSMSQVRSLRKEKGFSQRELAEKADISPGYLARIERGSLKAPIKALARIANALEVPIGEIA